MAYTSDTNVKKLLTTVQPQASVNAVDFTFFITRAERRINTKLAARYVVPFTTVPPMVEDMATEIAALMILRTFFTQAELKSSAWATTFNESDKMLDSIAAYESKLIDANGNDLQERSELCKSNNQGHTPVFGMDAIEDSVIDPNLLDAEASARE